MNCANRFTSLERFWVWPPKIKVFRSTKLVGVTNAESVRVHDAKTRIADTMDA
jgi:hypothetical protein